MRTTKEKKNALKISKDMTITLNQILIDLQNLV